jgi:RND family efflux transporter MFP subunit
MPSLRAPVPLLLGSGLLLFLMLAGGCGSPAQSSPEDTPASVTIPVAVATVEQGVATAQLSSTAALEAENEATVVARVGGVVTEMLIEEGQYVEAGQPLARLNDERLRLEVDRAETAQQRLKGVFERTETMYEKQLVSSETYDQAKSDYEAQRVTTELARLELTYATIRSPIAGWVSTRHIKTGNMVSPNDPTFQVTNLRALRAVLHLPERELAKLAVGQSATLHLDALPDQTFEGEVTLLSPVVDPETGTLRVTVAIQDPSRTAKPGMFGRVTIQYDRRENALLIPKDAVVEEDDETAVFIVHDTLALRRRVTTGYSDATRIEIAEGLQVGDQVVVSGQAALRDSTRIEVVQ